MVVLGLDLAPGAVGEHGPERSRHHVLLGLGHGVFSPPNPSASSIEQINKQLKRRCRVVGIFRNEAAIVRRARAVLVDMHDEWQAVERRCFSESSWPSSTTSAIMALAHWPGCRWSADLTWDLLVPTTWGGRAPCPPSCRTGDLAIELGRTNIYGYKVPCRLPSASNCVRRKESRWQRTLGVSGCSHSNLRPALSVLAKRLGAQLVYPLTYPFMPRRATKRRLVLLSLGTLGAWQQAGGVITRH